MPMTLKNQNVAVEMARHSIGLYADAVAQTAANWQVVRACNEIMPALAGRMALFEYLSAASILADMTAFADATNAVLLYGDELATRFRPQPEVLLTEMALAILSVDRPVRRSLGKSISSVELEDQTAYLERYQALMLAALVDLDYDATQRYAGQLLHACAAREFDKTTTELAQHWAHAASKLADKDLEGCFATLQLLHEAHLKMVDRELGRLKKGASSDLSTFDILDLPCAALARLLGEFGFRPLQLSEYEILRTFGLWVQADQQTVDR